MDMPMHTIRSSGNLREVSVSFGLAATTGSRCVVHVETVARLRSSTGTGGRHAHYTLLCKCKYIFIGFREIKKSGINFRSSCCRDELMKKINTYLYILTRN